MNAKALAKVREQLVQLAQALSDGDDPANENAATVELDQAKVGRLSRMDALQMQAMAAETGRRRQTQQRRIQAAAPLCIDCANEAAS